MKESAARTGDGETIGGEGRGSQIVITRQCTKSHEPYNNNYYYYSNDNVPTSHLSVLTTSNRLCSRT